MAIAKHETYALDLQKTGNVFATVNYKSPKTEEEEIDCLLCHDTIYTFVEVKPDFKKYYLSIFQNLSKLPNGAYYILFGFLLFLNISMFSIKERLQIHPR